VTRLAIALALSGALGLTTLVVARQGAPSVDLVEVDVVVVDGKDQPITRLQRDDFTVKEDGRIVDVKTFSERFPSDPRDPDDVRSVAILMDDAGVPPTGNETMKTIARAFVASAAPRDEISIVRLHNYDDEPFGDRRLAESRIAAYRANSAAFTDWGTPGETLDRMAGIARLMEGDDHRRKVIVCVGAPAVCNIAEPPKVALRALWPRWVRVLTSTAKANVSIYAIVPGRATLRGGGLSDYTGGEVFATTYDLGPAIDRILRDANHHYMLGYWPDGKSRELHSIDVKVARHGARVHARRRRGD